MFSIKRKTVDKIIEKEADQGVVDWQSGRLLMTEEIFFIIS